MEDKIINYETLARFLKLKAKLLENFIFETNRLADLYGWRTEPEEQIELERISKEIDDVQKQIEKILEQLK